MNNAHTNILSQPSGKNHYTVAPSSTSATNFFNDPMFFPSRLRDSLCSTAGVSRGVHHAGHGFYPMGDTASISDASSSYSDANESPAANPRFTILENEIHHMLGVVRSPSPPPFPTISNRAFPKVEPTHAENRMAFNDRAELSTYSPIERYPGEFDKRIHTVSRNDYTHRDQDPNQYRTPFSPKMGKHHGRSGSISTQKGFTPPSTISVGRVGTYGAHPSGSTEFGISHRRAASLFHFRPTHQHDNSDKFSMKSSYFVSSATTTTAKSEGLKKPSKLSRARSATVNSVAKIFMRGKSMKK